MRLATNLLFAFLIVFNVFTGLAQEQESTAEQLNNYKYVVVPLKFSFQDEENEYLINSRLKHLLSQHDFNTLIDKDELPEDLEMDRCLALYADLESGSEGF